MKVQENQGVHGRVRLHPVNELRPPTILQPPPPSPPRQKQTKTNQPRPSTTATVPSEPPLKTAVTTLVMSGVAGLWFYHSIPEYEEQRPWLTNKVGSDRAQNREKTEADAKKKADAAREARQYARRERERKERETYLASLEQGAGSTQGSGTGKARDGSSSGTRGTVGGQGRGDPGYAARLRGVIRKGVNFRNLSKFQGNPKAEFRVQLYSDGRIRSVQMTRSSGVSDWDVAAERGITRAGRLPCDSNGVCPNDLIITMRPRE